MNTDSKIAEAASMAASEAIKNANSHSSGVEKAQRDLASLGNSEQKDRELIEGYDSRDITRTPWTLTTEEFKSRGEEPLQFYINPSSYSLENPLRQQIVQAKGGPVVHTFRDPRRGNTNMGFASMNMDLQSGSLLPVPVYKSVDNQEYKMPGSLDVFYEWLKIIQQDQLWLNPETNEYEENYQILTINTLIFPHLVMYGFFVENANFGESSESPSEIQTWTGKFLIYKTTPPLTLDAISSLASSWSLSKQN